MAWITGPGQSQNGNTSAPWIISGETLTNHDVVVTKLEVGSSRLKIDSSISRSISPNKFHVSATRVIGTGTISFRFAAE